MKTLFLFTLTVILSISLNARENPFEATNAYEEEAARIIELNESSLEQTMQEEQYIKEMQEKMDNTSKDENKNKVEEAVNKILPVIEAKPVEQVEEKTYSKKEVDKIIKKTKVQTENRTKQIIKKELEKTKITEPTQVVYVKPRPDVIDEEAMLTKKLLDFIKVEYNDDKLIIHTDFKVSKKFTLEREKKIIIDYKASKNFYTKRDTLESKNFKKIAVGNHKKEKYFRVVIELLDKPSNYTVNYQDNLITISKSN